MGLIEAIVHHNPDVSGITVIDNVLHDWPTTVGPRPTQSQLDTWVRDYNLYKRSVAHRATREAALFSSISTEGDKALSYYDTVIALLNAHYGDSTGLDRIRAVQLSVEATNPPL